MIQFLPLDNITADLPQIRLKVILTSSRNSDDVSQDVLYATICVHADKYNFQTVIIYNRWL
jgi:hypothetical protein